MKRRAPSSNEDEVDHCCMTDTRGEKLMKRSQNVSDAPGEKPKVIQGKDCIVKSQKFEKGPDKAN